MVKIYSFITVLILSLNSFAEDLPLSKSIQKLSTNIQLDKEVRVYTLRASKDGMTLKKSKIIKTNSQSLKTHRLITPRDKYGLKLLNKDGEEVYLLGLGNPFYIHAQHLGYEDSNFFGGYIDTDIDISIPIGSDIAQIVLVAQDKFGLKEIEKILLQ